jgi:hypothetical protein
VVHDCGRIPARSGVSADTRLTSANLPRQRHPTESAAGSAVSEPVGFGLREDPSVATASDTFKRAGGTRWNELRRRPALHSLRSPRGNLGRRRPVAGGVPRKRRQSVTSCGSKQGVRVAYDLPHDRAHAAEASADFHTQVGRFFPGSQLQRATCDQAAPLTAAARRSRGMPRGVRAEPSSAAKPQTRRATGTSKSRSLEAAADTAPGRQLATRAADGGAAIVVGGRHHGRHSRKVGELAVAQCTGRFISKKSLAVANVIGCGQCYRMTGALSIQSRGLIE